MSDFESRAVYTSLLNTFKERQAVKDAFAVWRGFATEGDLNVIELVESIDKKMGLSSAERKSIMVGLFANLAKRTDELQEVPSFVYDESAKITEEVSVPELKEQSVNSGRPVHVQLCELMFEASNEVMQARKVVARQEVRQTLSEDGLDGLDAAINRLVKQGAQKGRFRFSDTLTEEDCRDILHDHYLLLCEIIGPIDADLVYQDSMSKLMQYEIARDYDPRGLVS